MVIKKQGRINDDISMVMVIDVDINWIYKINGKSGE